MSALILDLHARKYQFFSLFSDNMFSIAIKARLTLCALGNGQSVF